MRALTMEEVGWVAGGDAAGNAMIDVGRAMQNWAPVVIFIPKVGTKLSPFVYEVGKALEKQGEQRNAGGSGSGGGGGAGGEGGSPPVGNPGGYTDPHGGGGGGLVPKVCYGPQDCHDAGQGTG